MEHSITTEGFRLAYDSVGNGRPVVLLHGWPGDRTDYNQLVSKLQDHADVLVPDLRGFGQSDIHADAEPERFYSAPGQARGIIALMDELTIKEAVLGGNDVGSLVAQTVARMRPDLVRALVVSPPLPGAGQRILELRAVREFWYTTFNQQRVVEELIDGNPKAVRAYLRHFWEHWSGPNYVVDETRLNHLTEMYSRPGAFTASMGWYRSSGNPVTAYTQEVTPKASERLTTPTTILWQEHDPIFPTAWSDRIGEFFTDYEVEFLPGVGHYTHLEATDVFAGAIRRSL